MRYLRLLVLLEPRRFDSFIRNKVGSRLARRGGRATRSTSRQENSKRAVLRRLEDLGLRESHREISSRRNRTQRTTRAKRGGTAVNDDEVDEEREGGEGGGESTL
eukprot:760256-Hanusia_phi.AAC.2